MFKNNPIFIKDLLITLNSKQWKIVVFFFIFIYFLAFLLFLSEIKSSYNFYETSNIWKKLFLSAWIVQLIILTWISFFRWLQSFTTEKVNKTLDFIKISPISPTKFIIWKFLASISFILLLFLISIPFLSVGLVLGWVNLSDILIYSLYTFCYTSFAVLFWMMISSLSKNTVFSILYWFLSIPALIFYVVFFLGYTTDFFWFSNIFRYWSENIIFTIIPVPIFEYVNYSEQLINFFWLKIHYLFFTVAFFGIINYFLFKFLKNKYRQFSELNTKTFSYFETLLLILLFSIFSWFYENAIFGLVFSALILIYLFYIFNNSKTGIYKYIFFIIIFILASIIITVSHWFLLNSLIILFLIFLLFFTFADFLKLIFSKISTPIFNTIYLLFLILFFYIAPLISTNLLNIKFDTVNWVIKTALYKDWALKFNCDNFVDSKNTSYTYYYNTWKCRWIYNDSLRFYYFLYLMLNIAFIVPVLVNSKKSRK